MTATEKTSKYGTFALGMNNRAPDFRLRTEKGSFLRSIVNADVTQEGSVRRRLGYDRQVSGSSCRSLWSDGTTGFYADGATLYRLSAELGATAVYTSLAYGQPVSFVKVGPDVYYTDGQVLRRYDALTGDQVAGAPMLLVEPAVAAASGGALPAGRYTLCFTQAKSDGEESGSTFPVQVNVTAGKIDISGLPSALPTGIVAVNVYMSPINGDTMFLVAQLPAGTTYSVVSLPGGGARRCSTVLLAPMPAGRIVRFANGRLFVAAGNILYYSEPYAPALRNPAKGYIPFPAPVTMVEACEGGIYVAAGETYWLDGDIAKAELKNVLPYDAVYGASGQVPHENACWWMSTRGIVRGADGGEIENLQEDKVAVEPASAGAALFRERDGMKQALASMFNEGSTVMVARSYMDAEIIRKGTTL